MKNFCPSAPPRLYVFQRAVDYVLKKNADLYKRLS